MMRGPLTLVATFLLHQLSPASSFGGAPLRRPSIKGGSPTIASAATHAAVSSRQTRAPAPVGAKAGLFPTPSLSQRRGRADGALFAGGSKDGDVKDKETEAKPVVKKSSSSGGIGGWDWGFTSTSKKTATPKTTAVKPKKPVFSADDEAAEIEAVKRKAAAEIKAEQEAVKGIKAEKKAVADAPETDAELEEADEIAEIKRRAAAEVEAEKEKAKANKKEEDAKFAEEVAARVALRKRAEEMAAAARGDIPKSTAPAAKKPDLKKTPAEAKPTKADAPSKAPDGPSKAEAPKAKSAKAIPPKAVPSKAEPAKTATPAKSPPKKSSAGGMGGWDWGFTPSTKSTAAKAKPAAAPTKKKTEKTEAQEAAVAAAAAAKEDKAAAAKAEKEKGEAEKAKVEKEKAEKEKSKAAAAKQEAAAARAAQEKRAEEIAAKARGDVPEPKAKKPAAKTKETTADDAATSGAKTATSDVSKAKEAKKPAETKAKEVKKPAEPKKNEAETPAEPKKEESKKAAEPKKKEAEKPVVKKQAGLWGMATREVAAPSSLVLTKPETIVVVTGATGRVGSLAVRRLLELYPKVLVRAVVNDFNKGSRLLKEEKDKYGIKLEIVAAELGGKRSAAKVVEGASAVVFCASGFAQNLSPIQRLANAVRLTINPSSVADVEGVRDVAQALKATKKIVSKASKAKQESKAGANDGQDVPQPLSPNAPRFVLLSSAAVTRPNWSSEEKKLYPLAADVPIVKLNPLNILTVKAEGEKELREVGIPYSVVRPCGLNDDHPRGRPLFSVGDTAAGRICREDVADVLVRCLGTKEATGKTFEVQSLPGFEKVAASVKSNKGGIDQALSSLPTDEVLQNDPELLENYRRFSYPVLTQLRPVPLAQTPKQEE